MENETLSKATATTRPRLYGIVHTYIQKQLPRDIHPAFKALRDREEAATTLPQIGSNEETTSPLPVERERGSRVAVQTMRTHSQRFDNCARLCSYETILHTNETVKSHQKNVQNNHQEIVGQLDRLKTESFQQNNLLGNIVVTEAGNIQQMMGVMASKFNEMSESVIQELKESIVKETLENFLSSSNHMDFRTQDGQSRLWASTTFC